MGDTRIEWASRVWNPLAGCSPVSEGCRNCYAAREAIRLAKNPLMRGKYEGTAEMRGEGKKRRAVFTGRVNLIESALEAPLTWKTPQDIFVNSMSDLFHEAVPDWFIDRVVAVMALAQQHTFLVLTKRPERMAAYFAGEGYRAMADSTQARIARAAEEIARARGEDTSSPWWDTWLDEWPLRNVRLGTSVENQPTADERIPHLLRTPAAVRWLSCEPLLGPVDLRFEWLHGAFDYCPDETDDEATDECMGCPGWTGAGGDHCGAVRGPRVDWVVCGGESGHGARPCNLEWIGGIVSECKAAGVPVFVKQLGARPRLPTVDVQLHLRDKKGGDPAEWPEDLRVREYPEAQHART